MVDAKSESKSVVEEDESSSSVSCRRDAIPVHHFQQSAATMTTILTEQSIREAILHSATLLNTKISVRGTVVLMDSELGRMDVANDGAKLIVRLCMENSKVANIQVGNEVTVTGVLRKEQRRTFLQANRVENAMSGSQ